MCAKQSQPKECKSNYGEATQFFRLIGVGKMGLLLNVEKLEGIAVYMEHILDDFLWQYGPQKLATEIKKITKDFDAIQQKLKEDELHKKK